MRSIPKILFLVPHAHFSMESIAQKLPKKFEIFPAPSCKTRKKKSPQKKYLWVGGVHTMENKDTNTYYHKFVTVGDQN